MSKKKKGKDILSMRYAEGVPITLNAHDVEPGYAVDDLKLAKDLSRNYRDLNEQWYAAILECATELKKETARAAISKETGDV